MILGYFTAGIMLVLGVLLMVKFGREAKIFYPVGGVFVILGIWWGLSTLYPENEVITGWCGWVVKGLGAVALIALAIYFFVVRKREVDKFNASKEPKRTTLYENYDDFQYDEDKEKKASEDGDSADDGSAK